MGLQVRFLVLFVCAAATAVCYITQNNINIAIVSMVKTVSSSSSSSLNESSFGQQDHVAPSLSAKQYEWTEFQKGLIQGSFYISYILLQIPLGRFMDKYGGTYILVSSLFFSSLITLTIPFITDHLYILIGLRICLGAVQSGTFPSAFSIIVKWMPQTDRPLAFSMTHVGSNFGSFLVLISSGVIISNYSWPFVFWISGGISLVYSILLLILLSPAKSPETCRYVSMKERNFISSGQKKASAPPIQVQEQVKLNNKSTDDVKQDLNGVTFYPEENSNETAIEKIAFPWGKVMRSSAVLATLLYKFTTGWANFIILFEVPNYLNQKGTNLEKNGVITAITQVLIVVTSISCGFISERLVIEKRFMNRSTCRKVFGGIAGFGMATCLFMVPFAGYNEKIFIACIFLGSFFNGFTGGADIPLPAEMSVRWPTTLYAIFNIVSMTPGILVPYVVGITLDFEPIHGWPVVFYLSGICHFLSSVIFCIFASSDRQPFDYLPGEKRSMSLI